MSALALSVLLCLVSALCYAVAALFQERVAAAARRSAVHTTLRSGLWWTALLLNGGGGLLHVLALRWGPLTLVQPLGVLTLVFALPLSAPGRGRKPGRIAWAGVGLVAAGLAVLTALVDTGPGVPLSALDQSVIAGLGVGAVALLAGAAAGARRPAARGAALSTAAGVAFGVASVHVKAVVGGWGGVSAATEAVGLGLTAVMAVTGLATSQMSYRAGLTVPLVTTTLVNPVVASLIGVAAMDDGFRYGAAGVPLVVVAAVATAGGLLLVLGGRAGQEGAGRHAGAVPVASGAPRAPAGEHVPCGSVHRSHGREQPDVPRGQSCPKISYVSQ